MFLKPYGRAGVTEHGHSFDAPGGFVAVPLFWTNVASALTIAFRSFGAEALIIALCYLWYLLSRLGVRVDGLVLRRRSFGIMIEESRIAECELLTSPLYGSDVCWVRLSRSEDADMMRLVAILKEMTAEYRLAVFRFDQSESLPKHWPELQSHGVLAEFAIYSTRHSHDCSEAAPFARRPLAKKEVGSVRADFFLLKRNAKSIGLTGTYSVDFWPGIVWGGWGALIRSVGLRDAGLQTVAITENLARNQGARMFCIETSDGAKYRAARKIYEIYGLEVLLEIPDFYSDGESFLVFGKTLFENEG